MRILVVEDDPALGPFLQRGLELEGHRVKLACDGAAAVDSYATDHPDLTILDLGLPKKDGECVLAEIRKLDARLPVMVLTGRQELDVRVRCLDAGADDLVLKPFSFHELRARCRALLRRKSDTALQIKLRDLEINRVDRSVMRAGREVTLTNREFALLEQLALNRGYCIPRVELLETVWKLEPAQTTNIVDVYINYLRRKLGDAAPYNLIRTVRGKGYTMPVIDAMSLRAASGALEKVAVQI